MAAILFAGAGSRLRRTVRRVDGRLILLGLIVVLAVVVMRDMEPARSAAQLARDRAADAVLVEVDRTQLCYRQRRHRYAATIPSLQFAGGHFMRTALTHDLDIRLSVRGDGYVQRITGEGVDAVLERQGDELVRLWVGDRAAPRPAAGC
jgi:hypothetical protein